MDDRLWLRARWFVFAAPVFLAISAHAAPLADVPRKPLTVETKAATPEPTVAPATPVAQAAQTVHVDLYDINGNNGLSIDLPLDGKVSPQVARDLEMFFHCRRSGRHKPMDPGVLALLADVAQQFPGHVVEIISGYRSRPYGVRHSKHFIGHAIDLRVRGVRLTQVRDAMWKSHHEVGIGWYPHSNFLHVDSRPGEPDMAWTARGEGSAYHYNPYWAERARR